MLKMNAEKLGTVTILHLQGRIVTAEKQALKKAVTSQTAASAIVLDLAKVSGVDAGGLSLLLELREWTESKKIEFRLINASKLVLRVFELTRLDDVFEISSVDKWRIVKPVRRVQREAVSVRSSVVGGSTLKQVLGR